MNTKLQAVLWDMDGTIIDTEPAWVRAEKTLLAKFNAKFSETDLTDWVGIGLWDLAEIFQNRGVDLEATTIVKKLTELVNKEIFSGELSWRPGARELISGFTELGIPNALVTMATRAQALQIINHLPKKSFVTVTAGDDVTKPKPHPEPYIKGAASLGLNPSQCVAIEDSRTGVLSASAAGAFVLAVPNLVDLSNTPFSNLVNSLTGVTAHDIVEMFEQH